MFADNPPGAPDEIEYLRWQWFHDARFSADAPDNPRLSALQVIEQGPQASIISEAGTMNLLWIPIGPSPINGGQIVNVSDSTKLHVSGRIVGISVDPTEPDHWLLASAGGGIWETKDAGKICVPLTDDMPTMGMGAVTFAPGNSSVMYAGTSSTDGRDKGFLRSMDGGKNWQYLTAGTFSSGDYFTFNSICVDPEQSSNVVVATSDYFGPLNATGIFKSSNAGSTWRKRLAGDATHLEVHPTDFSRQYAGVRSVQTGSGSGRNGVWRTFDAAESWTVIGGPWGTVDSGDKGIQIAIAPSQPDTLYVSIGEVAVYRTDDAWSSTPTWRSIGLPPGNPGFDVCSVDPTDPERFFGGEVDLYTWNGIIWSTITSGTHVDQHAMAWSQGRCILGNDGGLWIRTNLSAAWVDRNASLGTVQFYAGAAHPLKPAVVFAGSQDNGTERWSGTNAWKFLYGGDGMECAFSYQHPDLRYIISAQGLFFVRTTDGANLVRIDSGIETANRPFYSKLVINPYNENVVLTGTDRLWRTTNAFTGHPPRWTTNSPSMTGTVTAIAFAFSDATGSAYAFGTSNGELRMTTNNGGAWINLDPSSRLPKREISAIEFDPTKTDNVYVTYSGFDDSITGHLFLTTNAFASSRVWKRIGPNINLPHNALVVDPANPANLVVGTDIGVWRSTNGASSWVHMGPAVGMPNVVVNDLKMAANGDVLAFTYGRGAFALRSQVVEPPVFGGLPDLPSIQILANGDLELQGTLTNSFSIVIESSSDLQNWSTVQTGTARNGVFDAVLHGPFRSPSYFRAKTPP